MFNIIVHCAKSMCYACSIFACVSGVYYRRVWDGAKHGNENELSFEFVESIGGKDEFNIHR